MGSPPPTEKKLLQILDMSQEYWGSRVTMNPNGMWFMKTAVQPVKYRCDRGARELIDRDWAALVESMSILRPTDTGVKELLRAGLLRRPTETG